MTNKTEPIKQAEKTKQNEPILINGKVATTEFYVAQSEKLTSVASRIEFIHKSLSNVAYQQRRGDMEAVMYFMRANLSCLIDNLEDIAETVQKISDSSCPD